MGYGYGKVVCLYCISKVFCKQKKPLIPQTYFNLLIEQYLAHSKQPGTLKCTFIKENSSKTFLMLILLTRRVEYDLLVSTNKIWCYGFVKLEFILLIQVNILKNFQPNQTKIQRNPSRFTKWERNHNSQFVPNEQDPNTNLNVTVNVDQISRDSNSQISVGSQEDTPT